MADRTFLDWPFFDDDHRRMAADLAAWTAREVAPLEGDEGDPQALTRQLVAKLGAAGWLRHVVPRDYGGARETLDVRSLCLARETLARAFGLAEYAFAMQGLGSASIALFGGDDLKRAYLPPVCAGERIAAFAMTEPGSGSDFGSIQTMAVAARDHYRLDGVKTLISNAGIADHYILFARTGEAGAKGLSAFVVDADAPGLEVSERQHLMAPHPIGALRLTNCRVPKAHRLGAPGDGFTIAMATLDIFRPSVGAAAVGLARRALDEAIGFTAAREAFGQTLADLQLVQAKLADMATEIDASALLVYRAAWAGDTSDARTSREAAMAKMYATEAAQRVIDSAVQLHGGRGVLRGETVERLYREVRALRIYEGATDIQKLIIARHTLKAAEAAAPAKRRGAASPR